MRLSRVLAGGALAALVTGTAAACGLQAAEPRIELRDAMSDFAAGRTGALELSVASSAEDVRAFAAAADPSGDAGMTDEDLEQLLSTSFEIGYDHGEDRDSELDDLSRVVVRLGNLDAGELRSVGSVLYARVDVDGLAEEIPEMQEGVDSFRAALTGADGVAAPMPPEMVEPATALLDGEWVSVDLQAYRDQLDQMAADAGQDAPAMEMSDYYSAEVRDLLGAALKDAVTSVERRAADEELGNHLVAGLDLRAAYTTLRDGLPELFEGEMADSLEQQIPPVDEVPDKQIDVSFWVRDGDLTRIELDVAQFLDEPDGSLVLRADVLAPVEITTPSGAVEFDFAALMEAAMSADPAALGDQPLAMPELDAYLIATILDGDIAASASEDGAVPSVDYLPAVLPGYEEMAPGVIITAVGERIQVALGQDVVCLTPSPYGNSEDIADGPC